MLGGQAAELGRDPGSVRRGLEHDRVAGRSAGPTLAKLIWFGKFHGVIAATTPIGLPQDRPPVGMPIGSATPRSVSHA